MLATPYRYLPGMQVISDDPGSMRANIKSRQMSLSMRSVGNILTSNIL